MSSPAEEETESILYFLLILRAILEFKKLGRRHYLHFYSRGTQNKVEVMFNKVSGINRTSKKLYQSNKQKDRLND